MALQIVLIEVTTVWSPMYGKNWKPGEIVAQRERFRVEGCESREGCEE